MKVNELDSQIVRVLGKPVLLTKQDIETTCKWYADNAQGCIEEVLAGDVVVNDKSSYIAYQKQNITEYETGNFEPWLGFWQQAIYLKTGESISILN